MSREIKLRSLKIEFGQHPYMTKAMLNGVVIPFSTLAIEQNVAYNISRITLEIPARALDELDLEGEWEFQGMTVNIVSLPK